MKIVIFGFLNLENSHLLNSCASFQAIFNKAVEIFMFMKKKILLYLKFFNGSLNCIREYAQSIANQEKLHI